LRIHPPVAIGGQLHDPAGEPKPVEVSEQLAGAGGVPPFEAAESDGRQTELGGGERLLLALHDRSRK